MVWWEAATVLPLGISFYTFQTMSYSIDVYRRDVKAEHNIIDFGAYVVMFPQLIAGPIVKYRDVAAQLHVYKDRYRLKQIEEGICLFVFGLAKKGSDCRYCKQTVVRHHRHLQRPAYYRCRRRRCWPGKCQHSSLVWLGLLAYSLQLYFDFSGNSLMGIGMGKMLGFDFPMNFNMPYIARSITDFWRRWHMTPSGGSGEYAYIPLGGNRRGLKRQIFNMFVVWTLTGIWHRADWNFIFWGIYYFILLAIEKIFLLKKLQTGRIWPHIYTLFLVAVGWALFVGNEDGVGLALLMQKLFIPSGGVSCRYFLRNYGVLLVARRLSAAPRCPYASDWLKKHTVLKILVVFALLLMCIA